MTARTWLPPALLLALAAAAATGWLVTRPAAPAAAAADPPAAKAVKGRRGGPVRERLVDQTPLFTARSLVPLAVTAEERELARQAERLANHEVDLAFTDALLRAASTPPVQTPEVNALQEQKAKAQAAVDADQQVLARLGRALARATEAQKGVLQDQLEVAKAQLELDKDELEAAAENLARAGGDPQARIKRLKEAHEAADRDSAAQGQPLAPSTSLFGPGSLVARLKEWRGQVTKYRRLAQARQEALDKAQALGKRRETIAERAKQEAEDREAAKFWANNLVQESAAAAGGPGREQAQEAVSYLKQYGDVQRRLSDMGRRVQDQQGLAETYGNWMALAEGYRTTALHGLLDRALWILALLLAALGSGRLIDTLFQRRATGDRKGASTPHAVLKMVVKVLCALAIGFVIFGIPAQSTTVFGLAGAGLTVALKDFIVAFFGWFILMGRNGIRVGDWVEIRGVGGEVVEIGLLRTVILETGNWTDSEHPTGRRVAFVNNFAIEGHFFNFSTSGRWMWDELRVLIPHGRDPYDVMDGVQKLVVEQTEANARMAEQDWKKATSRYKVESFTTTPGLFVVPTLHGIEIRARYITRATDRDVTRLRLNKAMVELMHGPRTQDSTAPSSGEAR